LGCSKLDAAALNLRNEPLFRWPSPLRLLRPRGWLLSPATVAMSSASPVPIIIDPERAAESNTAVFLTVVCGVWSLAFVTALVRFYTRAVLVRSFGKDDVFMVLAVVRPCSGVFWEEFREADSRRTQC